MAVPSTNSSWRNPAAGLAAIGATAGWVRATDRRSRAIPSRVGAVRDL